MNRTNLLFSLLLICLAAYLSAQQPLPTAFTYIQIDSTKQKWGDWDEPGWLRYFGLDAGDVDRDGNIDIISGRYIYHNPGGDMTGPWKRTVLDDNVDGILTFDVDGDPYADVIAMALPDLYWYESTNAAGTQYSRHHIGQVPATSHVNSQGFEKAQIIPGGPQEILIAGDGDIYLIEIPEEDADVQKWKVKLICQNTSDEGIGTGDIDGDGDLDVAAGRCPDGEDEPKILVWFENPGHSDEPWSGIVAGESLHPIDRVEVADVDGDGKTDIIVTEERYPGLEPDANFWWFGQQSPHSWTRNKITTQYSINNLDVADPDQDGDIDLLTAEHKGPHLELQLWENNGKGHFTKHVLDTGKENHLGTQFVDLDLDGDPDIIGAGWDHHQYMHVWRNDHIRSIYTGMIFREYSWKPDMVSDQGKFLRVGGKLDYAINPDHFPVDGHENGFIPLPYSLDLTNATGVEVIIERVQSHEDTHNLRIQFNNGQPIHIPEPATIPHPATNYMFHANIRVPVPLKDLNSGDQNAFRLTVAKDQSWNWPQNLVYGVVLRIYYNNASQTIARIKGLQYGDTLKGEVTLSIESDYLDDIASVQYIGLYEDVNRQGDGKYRQWQYHHHRGQRQTAIGQSDQPPFYVTWNTSWLPNQSSPIGLTALATDKKERTHVLPVIKNIHLPSDHHVSLIKPYSQDPFWTTRNGEHTQYLDIPFQPDYTNQACLYWSSWSPCYNEGLRINNITVRNDHQNTPCYDAWWHEETLPDPLLFHQGKNKLTTFKTPLHDGKMVHGMDVQWPGIMLKIKHTEINQSNIAITKGHYQNRPHYVVHTPGATWYYDLAGGGFSRIIDQYGNDWIQYKTKPWDEYPASAASSFRGLPNLVFGSEDGGAGHPGHDKCISGMTDPNKIRSQSKSGDWEWEWTFYEDYALLDILKTKNDSPYWFLYEGTPGGSYEPQSTIYGTDVSGPESGNPDFYKGHTVFDRYRWAWFARDGNDQVFFLVQLTPDDKTDIMAYLGNTEKGVESPDGMTVFGFGRGENTTPLLEGPQKFIIGWKNTRETNPSDIHSIVSGHISKLITQYNN